jgi:hypothetical protein
MEGMIRSLVWKEWREQRWKVVYCSIILAGFVLIGLRTRLLPDEMIIQGSMILGAFFVPLFIGMGLFATEAAEGSLNTLRSLPVQPRVLFLIKIISGALAGLIPFLIAGTIAILTAGEREITVHRTFLIYTSGYWFALALLAWIIAFGLRQPSEARVGLIGLGIVTAWVVLTLLCVPHNYFTWYWKEIFLTVIPLNLLQISQEKDLPVFIQIVIVHAVIAACLLGWASCRFVEVKRK